MSPDSHITLSWRNAYGDQLTETLAAPPALLAGAAVWQKEKNASPGQVRDWLVAQGAQLEQADIGLGG